MDKSNDALVLLSGGQDSTTCLFWAIDPLRKFDNVYALNIFYGQRHVVEIEAAKAVASMAGVDLFEIDASQIFQVLGNSALLEIDTDISKQHPSDKNLPASFVPGRNIMFLTIAAAWAFNHNVLNIITGVCQTDYSGYPDCRDNTIKSLQVTLSLGMGRDFLIHTPLMYLTKAESVWLAQDLGPESNCWQALGYSHTCYNNQIPPCGECPACKLRANGFSQAGFKDPLMERLQDEGVF